MNCLSPALPALTRCPSENLKVKSKQQKEIGKKIISFAFYLLPFAFVGPAVGAEKIYFSYGPLDFSLPVSALELYAREGKINDDLAAYAGFVDRQQLEQLRSVLLTKADVTPLAVSQFLYSRLGETLLQRVGEIVQTQSRLSGFYAIRSALILAAADPDGLTLLNVLKKFPTYGIRINSEQGFELIDELTTAIRQTGVAIAAVEQQSVTEALTNQTSSSNFADLRQPGTVKFTRETLILNNPSRGRVFPVDIYLPQQQSGRLAPLVVISHGLGGDRTTFAYLAEYLASYGFAVAVPEHPGSSSQQLQALINGLARDVSPPGELVDRPLDVKDVLNELERSFKGRLNVKQVGVIGQSFGGYTALALAGAQINFEKIQKDCRDSNDSLNLSLLLQCSALLLPPKDYKLQDERVKAAIAINPVNSTIFGPTQIAKIKVPVMLVSSSADTVAPALAEQIRPFTWLTTPQKYLVLMKQGTHFSTLSESVRKSGVVQLPPTVVGPDPTIAFQYMEVLSLAFMQTYVAGNSQYRPYLSAAYANFISQQLLPLSLIQSLTPQQLNGKTTAEVPKL